MEAETRTESETETRTETETDGDRQRQRQKQRLTETRAETETDGDKQGRGPHLVICISSAIIHLNTASRAAFKTPDPLHSAYELFLRQLSLYTECQQHHSVLRSVSVL